MAQRTNVSVDSTWSNYSSTYDEWNDADHRVCPDCKGTGLDRDEWYDCPTCDGEGEVTILDTRRGRVIDSEWRTET